MPLPILAGAAVVKIGAAVAMGAGGTAVYMKSKHKKEIARLQDRIYDLQRQLEHSRQREKELMVRINAIQKRKAQLLAEIANKQGEIEKLEKERVFIMENLKQNDTRIRKIVGKLTFREKELLAKVEELQGLLNEKEALINSEKHGLERKQARVVSLDKHRHNVEEELQITQAKVKLLQHDIEDLESELL